MRVRPAALSDAPAICAIFNQGIEDGCTLETELRTPSEREAWLSARGPRHPVLVACQEPSAAAAAAGPAGPGEIVRGWAALSPFGPRAAYRFVADLSIYVARDQRGRGVGRALLERLLELARDLDYHKVVLTSLADNHNGLALYRRLGFRDVGTYREQGRLGERWVDTVIMERLL